MRCRLLINLRKIPVMKGVNVNQCYSCHQASSWNDIKGIDFVNIIDSENTLIKHI